MNNRMGVWFSWAAGFQQVSFGFNQAAARIFFRDGTFGWSLVAESFGVPASSLEMAEL